MNINIKKHLNVFKYVVVYLKNNNNPYCLNCHLCKNSKQSNQITTIKVDAKVIKEAMKFMMTASFRESRPNISCF